MPGDLQYNMPESIQIIVSATFAAVLLCACVYFAVRNYIQNKHLNEAKLLLNDHTALKQLLLTLPAPVGIADNLHGRFLYVNENFLRLFDFNDIEEVSKYSIHKLVVENKEDGLNKFERYREIIEHEGVSANELIMRTTSGNELNIVLSAAHIEYNGKPCFIGVYQDVTELRKTLKTAYLALKKEKDENRYISTVLERLNNELTAPVNAISMLSDIGSVRSMSKEALEVLMKINEESRRITRTLNDNQSLTNAELANFSATEEEFELDNVLSTVLTVIARSISDSDSVKLLLNTTLDMPRFLIGDKKRLWLVLKSFLDNCVKFVKEGRIVISVTIDADHSDESRICISFMIKDNCVDNVRIESISDDDKTYGIGAAKKLITLLGGDSSIEYDKTGVLFKFSLPFKRSLNEETIMQTLDTPVLFGLNILLVDSDELSLKIMMRLINCSNAHPIPAREGKEALEQIKEQRHKGSDYDMILLDHDVTDAEAVLSIQNPPPIIILKDINKDVSRSEITSDIIEKPFVPTQFIRKICAVAASLNLNNSVLRTLPKFNNTTVLVCDDNVINREATASMLSAFNIDCVLAQNGKEAVDILRDGANIDMVLMDLYMPVMDGFDATRAIRRELSLFDLPIISLSADTMPQIIEKCIHAGMNGHLPKPIEFRALSDVLLKRIPAEKRA